MTPFDEARAFWEHLERERREFPLERVRQLIRMRPGIRRTLAALRVLPALIRMANRTLNSRWRSASTPPEFGVIVTVHALGPGGGFIRGWYSDGRWWTNDFVDDGTTWGSSRKREIRVREYRTLEGSRAEPWHDALDRN